VCLLYSVTHRSCPGFIQFDYAILQDYLLQCGQLHAGFIVSLVRLCFPHTACSSQGPLVKPTSVAMDISGSCTHTLLEDALKRASSVQVQCVGDML